jgi:hypothetical protein
MTDSGSLWLRIVTASIPLIAALMAGGFALTNTVSRRIERLKNVVAIREDFPDWLGPDYTLERIMLRELQAIDQATTPVLRWARRIRNLWAVVSICGYVIWVPHLLGFIPRSLWHSPENYALSAIFLILTVANTWFGAHRQRFRERYEREYNAIDQRAQSTEELSAKTEPRDAAEPPLSIDSDD